jgi:hypothetical protein
LFLIAEGDEIRLELSRQRMQSTPRGGDETVELRQLEEIA